MARASVVEPALRMVPVTATTSGSPIRAMASARTQSWSTVGTAERGRAWKAASGLRASDR